MLLTQVELKNTINRQYLSKYIDFANQKRYPLEMSEIHPKHVLDWINHMSSNELSNFKTLETVKLTFYFIFSRSKYPMALYLKKANVIKLLDKYPAPIDIELFSWLFDFFLDSSKRFADDARGKDLIADLPTFISENRDEVPNSFLSLTSDCFRMTTVVDFYIWVTNNYPDYAAGDDNKLYSLLEEYDQFLSKSKSYGKSKIFISFALQALGKKIPNSKLDNNANSLVMGFVISKKNAIPIHFKSQLISKTRWRRQTLDANKKTITSFSRKVASNRGYYGDIDDDFICSLTLQDFLAVQENQGVTAKEIIILRQLLPWLLEQPNLPSKYVKTIEQLFTKMPSVASERESHISINFLSRLDYVTCIRTALTEFSEQNSYRNAIYQILAGFCALRRTEAIGIRVSNFVLDERNLMADMSDGYGMLILPKEQSKGRYSPSLTDYHIPVVPRARKIINSYLQSDFMQGYNADTFLLRRKPVGVHDSIFDQAPKNCYDNDKWLSYIGFQGDIIMRAVYEKAKPKLPHLKGIIGSHDLRRSINEFIISTPTIIPKVDRIAEIHLRHKKTGSTNKKYYQGEPSREEHIICIDNALNFPWEPDDLRVWEEEHNIGLEKLDWGSVGGVEKYPSPSHYSDLMKTKTGQSKSQIEQQLIPSLKSHNANPQDIKKKELEEKIAQITYQLEQRPKNRIKLEAELRRLEDQLNNL